MEDALNQRRDALQWERDEELAALEKEEGSLSDLKVNEKRTISRYKFYKMKWMRAFGKKSCLGWINSMQCK